MALFEAPEALIYLVTDQIAARVLFVREVCSGTSEEEVPFLV
jgi:hypothetical protein